MSERHICQVCGRHTIIRDGIVLKHSNYLLLPAAVTCTQSGLAPFEEARL